VVADRAAQVYIHIITRANDAQPLPFPSQPCLSHRSHQHRRPPEPPTLTPHPPPNASHPPRAVKRIEDAMRLRAAQFSEDAGPMAHPIRPDSYIKMDNFYTVTVYEKVRALGAVLCCAFGCCAVLSCALGAVLCCKCCAELSCAVLCCADVGAAALSCLSHRI